MTAPRTSALARETQASPDLFTPKRIAAVAIAAVVIAFLGAEFLMMVKPSIERADLAACNGLKPSRSKRFPSLPTPAPELYAQDVTGKMVPLSAYRGQVVLLNFWASWCPPCIDEVPAIEALQRELGPEGLVVLAVASNPTWDSVLEPDNPDPSKAKWPGFPDGTPLTVLLDPAPEDSDTQLGVITTAFGVPALPETFLIDRDGNIRYYYVNKRDWHSDVAARCIRSLLDE